MSMESDVIMLVLAELQKAREKFPTWPKDIVHAGAVVAEEAGELTQATLDYFYGRGTKEQCYIEAKQTAAMAIRFLCDTMEQKEADDEICTV